MEIQNTRECFVQLWLRLERTRQLLAGQHMRFCIRNVLRSWFGIAATDDFIWDVCRTATLAYDEEVPIYGNDLLPPLSLYPRKHRELLRALIAVKLGIGIRKVNLHALDTAYSVAFPRSTPLNVNKKAS